MPGPSTTKSLWCETMNRRNTIRGIAVLGVWAVALAALLPAARRAPEVLEINARIEGSESATVDRLLVEQLGSPLARSLIVVVDEVPAPSTELGRAVFARVQSDLRTL